MKSLPEIIGDIQGAVGVTRDKVFGPVTAQAVWRFMCRAQVGDAEEDDTTPSADPGIDPRSAAVIATLDPKFQPRIKKFLLAAKATAATYGCDYRIISGGRSWEEQAELYRKSQAGGPHAAPPGYSWHNFGVACDAGVFRGQAYLDDTEPALADKIHAAIGLHAAEWDLVWGGRFTGKSNDDPHWQAAELPLTPNDACRAKFQQEGSVL